MASLGWLLNLGFAASGVSDVTGPAAGSLLLLGVGRMWWVPIVWPLFTGNAYAGEIDNMIGYISNAMFLVAGGLLGYGLYVFKVYRDKKRAERLPKAWVDEKKRLDVVGFLGGPERVCDHCKYKTKSKDEKLYQYSSGFSVCESCHSKGVADG